LDRLRSDPKAFQTELYEQIFTGQCVEIVKGKVVEGSGSATSPFVLLIDRRIQPPGFLAPLRDFRRFKPVSSRNRIDAGHAAAAADAQKQYALSGIIVAKW